MKPLIVIILMLLSFSSLAGYEEPIVNKKQRKLVSQFYETLELFPQRCPKSLRNEYLQSVVRFEKAYPEFIALIRGSFFRPYAIKNFSMRKSPFSRDTCLLFKKALDMQVDTGKGQKGMKKNAETMRENG